MDELNNATFKNTTEYVQQYLSMLQHQSTIAFIPTLVYLCLISVTGCVGNCLVIFVHYKKMTRTPLKMLIISMAVFDLLIDIIVIPGEFYELFHVWDFKYPIICQLKRYFGSFFLSCSSFVLVSIAATRYRMVCCSAQKQITIFHVKIICAVIVFFALISSVLYGFIHGSQTRRTPDPDINGHFCQVDDTYVATFLPTISSALYNLLFLAGMTLMIFFYIKIGSKVWKHKITQSENQQILNKKLSHDSTSAANLPDTSSPVLNSKQSCQKPDGDVLPSQHLSFRRSAQFNEQPFNMKYDNKTKSIVPGWTSQSGAPSNTSIRNTDCIKSINVNDTILQDKREISKKYKNSLKHSYNRRVKPDYSLSGSWSILTSLGYSQPEKRVAKKSSSLSSTSSRKRHSIFSKTSWMMLTISVVSLVGYCPFFALQLYKTFSPDHYAALEGVQLAMFHLFYRSYLSTSALNPIVYSVMNRKFRKECWKLFVITT
ncbi:hypothetical protein Btru_051578 [Bulinus truncatus]|nr:hypothetical protein Btru_051578 [Bulinus truncatus]